MWKSLQDKLTLPTQFGTRPKKSLVWESGGKWNCEDLGANWMWRSIPFAFSHRNQDGRRWEGRPGLICSHLKGPMEVQVVSTQLFHLYAEKSEGASHVRIWRQDIPERGNRKSKYPEPRYSMMLKGRKGQSGSSKVHGRKTGGVWDEGGQQGPDCVGLWGSVKGFGNMHARACACMCTHVCVCVYFEWKELTWSDMFKSLLLGAKVTN